VLGKFLGLMLFLLLIVSGCTLMVLSLSVGTPLDMGLVLGNALGLLLLAAAYAALGLYISSLSAQPVVAAIAAIAALFGLWLVEISAEESGSLLHLLAPTSHFQSFNIGLLNSADLIYFMVLIVGCLLLTIRRVYNNRIYG